jgi:hypothetical protein
MVVDDDRMITVLVREWLEGDGYEVFTHQTWEEPRERCVSYASTWSWSTFALNPARWAGVSSIVCEVTETCARRRSPCGPVR